MRWDPTLVAASRALEVVNGLARALYTSGLRRRERAPVPVVAVGNIALGGVGKTPLVALLARTLVRAGARPAILTRGYGRLEKAPVMITAERSLPWQLVGDEPALLALTVPEVPIIVDANRVRGARTAVAACSATHLLLDDGFQHWRLARDLDIVVAGGCDPLCRRAPRREAPRALRRAGAIVVSNVDAAAAEPAFALLRSVAPDLPLFATSTVATGVHRGDEPLAVAALAGKRVAAVAGIASPDRFFTTVRSLGADVVSTAAFPDHHAHTRTGILELLAAAQTLGAELVVTGKDAVKVPADLLPRLLWLEIEARFVVGGVDELLRPLLAASRLESAP